jgi:hypothetical protein
MRGPVLELAPKCIILPARRIQQSLVTLNMQSLALMMSTQLNHVTLNMQSLALMMSTRLNHVTLNVQSLVLMTLKRSHDLNVTPLKLDNIISQEKRQLHALQ